MTRSSKKPTPPEGLPKEVVSDLNELSAEDLRKTIVHAQELRRFHEEPDPLVEPNPGEDILRVTEHDGYTEVVKPVPCGEDCRDCPHGPYLYHVKQEPRLDGEEKPHWVFIGEVEPDDE